MESKFSDWIAASVAANGNGYAECDTRTRLMVEAFPELRRVPGYYYCPIWGRRTHWWCVTQDGTVIDPTATQFPLRGIGVYEEVTDFSKLPTGVCMDCGDPVYNHRTFCNEECEMATRAYLAQPRF